MRNEQCAVLSLSMSTAPREKRMQHSCDFHERSEVSLSLSFLHLGLASPPRTPYSQVLQQEIKVCTQTTSLESHFLPGRP